MLPLYKASVGAEVAVRWHSTAVEHTEQQRLPCMMSWQAEELGKLIAAKTSAKDGMLSTMDMKGISNQVQRAAAGVLEFPYGLVKGRPLLFCLVSFRYGCYSFGDLLFLFR